MALATGAQTLRLPTARPGRAPNRAPLAFRAAWLASQPMAIRLVLSVRPLLNSGADAAVDASARTTWAR